MRKLVSVFGIAVLVLWFSAGKKLRAQEITLSLQKPQKQEVTIEFGSEEVKEIPITVKSGNDSWVFVKFNVIPEKTWIRIRTDVTPHAKDQEIAAGKWYALKGELGLILKFVQSAGHPTNDQKSRKLNLFYQFGIARGVGSNRLETADADWITQFVETENAKNQGNIVGQDQNQLVLNWPGQPIHTAGNAPQSKSVSTLVWVGVGVAVAVMTLIGLLVIGLAVFKSYQSHQKAKKQNGIPAKGPLEDYSMEAPKIKEPEVPVATTFSSRLEDLKQDYTSPRVNEDAVLGSSGNGSYEETIEDELKSGGEKLTEESDDIGSLKTRLDDIERDLNELKSRPGIQPDTSNSKQETEAFDGLTKNVEFLIKENSKNTGISVKQQELETTILCQMVELDQFRQEISDLKTTIEKRAHQNGFYEGIIGLVLGKSIESLNRENFDSFVREVEENLNRLVREDVPSSDDFRELEQQAVSVSETFQTAFQKICAAQPEMESKLRPYLDHANQIASDLKHFSSQLKSRQLNFNIRVSAHAGARDPFLAELGSAIKRELDKLRDPQAFWKHELERLATSHVIPVVDIYDKELARSHSSDGEIEKSLSALFAQTGLSPIRPQPGEPFKPADQNLIQMVAGPAGNSQKIARVFSRGFNYTDKDGNKRLIRKAGVEIYR